MLEALDPFGMRVRLVHHDVAWVIKGILSRNVDITRFADWTDQLFRVRVGFRLTDQQHVEIRRQSSLVRFSIDEA